MLPWTAEVGQNQVISDLGGNEALIYVDEINNIWGRPNDKFMSNIISYLKSNYIQADHGFYLSKSLSSTCKNISSPIEP